MAVERDGQKLRFWFPTLRFGCLSLLRWTTAFLKAQRQQRVVTGP